jgi:hypothetical protein
VRAGRCARVPEWEGPAKRLRRPPVGGPDGGDGQSSSDAPEAGAGLCFAHFRLPYSGMNRTFTAAVAALIFAVGFAGSVTTSAWALDQEQRFVEFPNEKDTVIFDLSTVQMIQPGRFAVTNTTIGAPDVMRLELKVLDSLRTYCSQPDGRYPPPTSLFALGAPDMPVKNIEVQSSQTKLMGTTIQTKVVTWFYPYRRLAFTTTEGPEQRYSMLHCKGVPQTNDNYRQLRAMITNGNRAKYVFDCRRGMMGLLFLEDEDLSKVTMEVVPRETRMSDFYRSICYRVTHELPYEAR